MEARKLVAVGLVLALTGSAVAAQQQRLYKFEDLESMEVQEITGVQQHTIFVELIVEQGPGGPRVVPFGAVVGLVKSCTEVRTSFDNAVLWFNDQFLFGAKQNETINRTPDSAIGENPPDSEIYPNCYIPDGFAHAVPAGEASEPMAQFGNTTIDEVRTYMKYDRLCNGCIIDYETSFYVTDPNGNQWLVDRMVYDLQRADYNLDGEKEDPLQPGGRSNPEETDGRFWVVHLQVDPSTGQGFEDQAEWGYPEDGMIRQGMPYNESVEDDPSTPEDERKDVPSIEYDFLLSFHFDNVADDEIHPERNDSKGPDIEHGKNGSRGDDRARDGNSHPSNPRDERQPDGSGGCTDGSNGRSDAGEGCEPNPDHLHSTVKVDIFFANKTAHWVHENRYWDEHGAPPSVSEDCETGESGNATRDQAVEVRTFLVCDRASDEGIHKHDGSQTIRAGLNS